MPYAVRPVNIFAGEHLADAFGQINPNRRIPALVDRGRPDGPVQRVFESGAILLYLAEKYGQFLPPTAEGRFEAIQWLMWQMAGLGPILGQAQHFWTYAKDKHPYSIDRYTKEGRRLFSVMDRHLAAHEFLADSYSIADIACFPWVRIHKLANLSLEDFPHLRRWYGAIWTRPAVERGLKNLAREPDRRAGHQGSSRNHVRKCAVSRPLRAAPMTKSWNQWR